MSDSVEPTDLFTAVEEVLKRSGTYKKIKAQVRAQVFQALEDKTVVMPDQPPEVFLVCEMLKDFLAKFKLNNTMSVFIEEMGLQESLRVERELVGHELGVNVLGSDENIPLLLLLVKHMQQQKKDYIDQVQSSLAVETDHE
ncbi:hypothetical protein EON64_01050 [archaeon]|nr:MAG: hypothetical protein EON64_01050 [archaeon]